MLQLVLDTNVPVAGLRSKRGNSYRLLRLFTEGIFRIHVSVALALEYEDVLKRPGLMRVSRQSRSIISWIIFSVSATWNDRRPVSGLVCETQTTSVSWN